MNPPESVTPPHGASQGHLPVSGRVCPSCSAPEGRWLGHEIRGVYDGVLYWSCLDCGHAWNRWTDPTDRRHEAAEKYLFRHRTTASEEVG